MKSKGRTFDFEEDSLNGRVEKHIEILRIAGGEEVGGGVTKALLVEDGAADLSAVEMIVGVAIERRHTSLKQTILQSSLPWRQLGPVNYLLLNPWVGFIHQLYIPPSLLHEATEPEEFNLLQKENEEEIKWCDQRSG